MWLDVFVKGQTIYININDPGPNHTRTHSMARHRKSPHSQRNLTVIDPLTLPKAQGGGGTQKIVPVHVPFM